MKVQKSWWAINYVNHITLDVLWGQLIKLIQVVSASEFHEYGWNNFDFIIIVPSTCYGASEVET